MGSWTCRRKRTVVRNEWRFVGDRGWRANLGLTGVDMEREGGMVSEDIVATPWVAELAHRVEVNAKWVMCCQVRVVLGESMDGVDPQHWLGFGNRHYDGQQNTFRANVLRSGFLGSEDRQFSAGVSYLYDDFLELGTWGAVPTDANANPEVWARTRTRAWCVFGNDLDRESSRDGRCRIARGPTQLVGHGVTPRACAVECGRTDIAGGGGNGISDATCLWRSSGCGRATEGGLWMTA